MRRHTVSDLGQCPMSFNHHKKKRRTLVIDRSSLGMAWLSFSKSIEKLCPFASVHQWESASLPLNLCHLSFTSGGTELTSLKITLPHKILFIIYLALWPYFNSLAFLSGLLLALHLFLCWKLMITNISHYCL